MGKQFKSPLPSQEELPLPNVQVKNELFGSSFQYNNTFRSQGSQPSNIIQPRAQQLQATFPKRELPSQGVGQMRYQARLTTSIPERQVAATRR